MKRMYGLLLLAAVAGGVLGVTGLVQAGAIGNPNPDNGWSSISTGAVGDPSRANLWSSTSAVSIRAFSSTKTLGNPRPWERTIDGSGLDAETGLLHDNSSNTVGMSGTAADNIVRGGTVDGYVWVEYDLGAVYELGEMWIWNYNELNWPWFGMRRVTIEYSTTGSTDPGDWTTIFSGEVPLATGGGLSDSPVDKAVDFAGAAARYVVITTDDPPYQNWKPTLEQVGWGEVRFKLPAPIKVTASSSHPTRAAINVLNGSGIDPCNTGVGDEHDTNWVNMWLSGSLADSAANPNPATATGSHWIHFEFDQTYEMDKMWIWNYNEFNWPWFGMKDVTIEYSSTEDPNVGGWQTIYEGEIPMASGAGLNPGRVDLEVKFGGVPVRHVVITPVEGITRNWSFADPCGVQLEEVGLSEVRFFTVPQDCAEVIAGGYGDRADINEDCYVDLRDFAALAREWMECVDPTEADCRHPW